MGGVIDTLFGGGQQKGYEDLRKYIGQGSGARTDWERQAEQALSPYTQGSPLMEQYQKAIAGGADPAALYNQLAATYQQSPLAKTQTEAGMNAIRSAEAASGMHGSGAEMQELQKNAQNITSADQQDYINKLLGIRSNYLGQLGGLAGNESAQQYGARGQIGNWRYGTGGNLANDLQQQGAAQYNEDTARAQALNRLFGGGLNFASHIPGLDFLRNLL